MRGEPGAGVQIKLKGHIVVSPSIHPDYRADLSLGLGLASATHAARFRAKWLLDLIVLPTAPEGVEAVVIEEDEGGAQSQACLFPRRAPEGL